MKALRRYLYLLLALWLPGMVATAPLQAGAPAPAFSLPDADGRIAKIYRKVAPATHATQLLADIEDLQRDMAR